MTFLARMIRDKLKRAPHLLVLPETVIDQVLRERDAILKEEDRVYVIRHEEKPKYITVNGRQVQTNREKEK